MRRSLSHMLNRKLSAGWNSWVEMMLQRSRRLQQLRRAVLHGVSRAVACWAEHAAVGRDSRASMTRAVAFLGNRPVAQGFATWLSFVLHRASGTLANQRGLRHSGSALQFY